MNARDLLRILPRILLALAVLTLAIYGTLHWVQRSDAPPRIALPQQPAKPTTSIDAVAALCPKPGGPQPENGESLLALCRAGSPTCAASVETILRKNGSTIVGPNDRIASVAESSTPGRWRLTIRNDRKQQVSTVELEPCYGRHDSAVQQ